jgi:hypothetical protein
MAVRRIVGGRPVVTQRVVDPAVDVVTTETVVDAPPVIDSARVVGTPQVVESHRVVRRSWARFSVAQVIHGACGLVLVIIGAVSIGRAGFGDGLGTHTTEVLGLTTTALIGLVEVFAGLLLLCAALSPEGRGFGGAIGVVLLITGVIVAAGSDQMLADLHTESGLGWIGIVIGAAAMLAAVLPTFLVDRRSTAVDVW